MSLIILRRSASCAYIEVDTRADLRQFTGDLGRPDKHWHGCTSSWHLSGAAVALLHVWAGQHGHTVTDERRE